MQTSSPEQDAQLVSCRNIDWVFDVCEKHQIPLDKIFEGLKPAEYFKNIHNFVTWDEFLTFANRTQAYLSEEQIIAFAIESLNAPSFRFYAIMSRIFSQPFTVYKRIHGEEGALKNFYPVKTSCIQNDKSGITIEISMFDGLERCPVFFTVIKGQLMGLTKVMGLKLSEVVQTDTANGVIYQVQCPTPSFMETMTRAVRWPFNLLQAAISVSKLQDELVGANRDLMVIEKKIKINEKLATENYNKYLLLADHTSDVIWIANMQLEQLYLSPSIEKLVGYTVEEAMALAPLAMIVVEYREDLMQQFADEISNDHDRDPDRDVVVEAKQLHKDGHEIWVEIRTTFERDKSGTPIAVIGVTRDITERKETEKRQLVLQEQLQVSQRMESVGQLAGGIAHDFNNLLLSILGYTELARDTGPNPAQLQRYLDEIMAAGKSAADLVQQLLAYSRRQILKPASLDLNERIEHLKPMLRHAVPSNIRLHYALSQVPTLVIADASQVERVLINLIFNARDAVLKGGEITISTGLRTFTGEDLISFSWATAGDFAYLEVKDDGAGIKKEHFGQIFEPFFTTKPVGEGTGLGLSVIYGIVEQHKGFIHFENNFNLGATFCIYLPSTNELPVEKLKSSATEKRLGLETILVVEDQESVRKLLKEVLTLNGYKVIMATGGHQALELYNVQKANIDLVLLDVVMPKMGGEEVMQKLQSMQPAVKIIFVTAYADDDVHTDFLLKQNLTLIGKPFRSSELLDTIRSVLDGGTD